MSLLIVGAAQDKVLNFLGYDNSDDNVSAGRVTIWLSQCDK